MKRRILFFSPYYFPYTSGITTYPQRLFHHLKKDYDIIVLTFKHNTSLPSQESFDGYTIHRMPFLFKISKGFISPQSLGYFIREILKTDVVLLNIPNFEALLLTVISFLLRKKIISIFYCVVTLSDDIYSKIIEFCLNCSMFIQLLLSKTIIGLPDYVESTWVWKLFKTKIKITLPPIRLVNRRVYDPLTTDHLPLSTDHSLPILGFAGRISREKGIEYLIESIRLLSLDYRLPTRLLLAGPSSSSVAGELAYFKKIQKLLETSSIKYKILGFLTEKQLVNFYQSIDMLVLPSINSTEAFGMVQAEAMLAGTPVVTTNLPGVRVPVQLTNMGIIVEPKNPQKLADAIYTIVENKDLYTNPQLVKQAQNIFAIEKTVEYYKSLL